MQRKEGKKEERMKGRKEEKLFRWQITLIPALGKQKWAGVPEFEASLFYRVSSRTIKVTQRNSVLKNKNEKKGRENERKRK